MVTMGRQAGPDGVARPTLDISSVLGRYEWDSVKQELPLSRQRSYMGKAWARATLQWSLRLQWQAEDGRVIIATLARKGVKELILTKKKTIKVTTKNVEDYLGVPRYRYGETESEDLVGVVTGQPAQVFQAGPALTVVVGPLPGQLRHGVVVGR